jgi:hypothetical protein
MTFSFSKKRLALRNGSTHIECDERGFARNSEKLRAQSSKLHHQLKIT